MKLEARLRAFAAFARQRSFSAAAAELRISQPAVSKHIAELEDTLELELVERARRGTLTNAGDFVANYVLRAEALLVQAGLGAAQFRKSGPGSVAVAASTLTGTYLLPEIIAEFQHSNPGVRITLQSGSAAQAVELLRSHRAELAFVAGAVAAPEIECASAQRRDPRSAPKTLSAVSRRPRRKALKQQAIRSANQLGRVGQDCTPIPGHFCAPIDIQAISRPFDLKGHQALLTTSVGIALYEKNGQNTTELLQNADNALYRAKSTRRGTLHFFDKALNDQLDARKKVERELRAALMAKQFVLFYQPQITLPSGTFTGVEVLIRWQHPIRGVIGPDEFIPLAEETGLIVPIGEWALRTACSQAAKWPDLTLAVNISPVQFSKGQIAATVRAALEESGLPPNRLELEITEGILIADTQATLKILNDLRTLGVRIVMDDFGTGYSSLGYLRKFPFDKLKLDKSFVRELGQNTEAEAIAHTIIDLARTLKMTANAEGVESQKQLDWLVEEGCGEVQGYWFGRPMDHSDVDQFLATFKPGALKTSDGDLSAEELRKRAGIMAA